MAGLEKALFNLKFTAKQLNRQAAKASKDEQTEKTKLKKVAYTLSPDRFHAIACTISALLLTLVTTGDSTRPLRHRQNLRPECDPQEEREPQPTPLIVENRCSKLQSADRCHDAAGYGQHGECGQGHGFGDEEYGSLKGNTYEA